MAPVDSTSSPRDHAADANPELSRKKQRLSEDPGASPSDSIIIEADEPEDIGSNMDNAIEIEDGLSVTPPPYGDDFYMLSDSQQPLHHLRYLLQRIQQNYYLSIESLLALAQALEQHNDRTADETDEWKQHYLEEEAEFFNTLATLIFTVLNTNDVFDPKEKADVLTIRQAVDKFLSGVERLSRRIIPCLPDSIKVTLSRRDSAHNSSRQHAINALFYCVIANQVLGSDERGIPSLACVAGLDLKNDIAHLRKNNRNKFSTDAIISALAAIIRVLGGAMREVKDSWIVVQHTLNLFSTAVEARSPVRPYPRGEVESVMEIVNACILPIIREKHPRALPEKFHDTVIKWGQQTLLQHVSLLDMSSATDTFRLFVSGSSDALLPEATDDGTVESVLQRVCDGNKDVLAKLIADSWTMQTAKTFICSDIMDIRTVGISALLARLILMHNHHQRFSPEGFEHPEVQHAVRFLRKNEVVAYILGPESRAGLLNQSIDVVTFLAATQTYTDDETDIIWQACSTSVEADFVKAAFAVLYKIKQWLDFERLLYIARKFSTTPVTSFGVDALAYLPDVLREIEAKSSSLGDATDGLAVVYVSIEILKNSNRSDPCRTRDRLKQVALTEISRFACPPFTSGVRARICKSCVPEILNRTPHATSAVEVLDVMLQPVSHHEEAEEILSLLPLSAAVDELCSFVQTQKQNQVLRPEIRGITVRLDCLARLVTLSPTAPGADIHERLFAHLFGDEAFSNEARNAAWEKLYSMAFSGNSRPALVNLFQIYMREYVAALPASLATPKLIEIMLLYLKSTCADDITEDDMTPLLSLPLWKSMLRFATTSPDEVVVRAAVGAILDVLFVFPCNGKVRPSAAIECQREFVRKHIEGLRSLNDQFVAQKRTEDSRNYERAMNMLDKILEKSKEYLPAYKLAGESDVLLVDDLHTGTDQFDFTAQVYGINTHPNLIKVRAKYSTTVSELLAKLPTFTSAAENRVVAGGVEITDVPDKTLSEVGVRESGVILIRPKYSFNLDLDKVLTNPGPVEQAILSQHSTLEAFLDGPDQTAVHAFQFLQKVRIPAQSRFHVVSSSTTADDLFPQDRQYRTHFSLSVLRTHLSDFARLGVADRGFVLRATHLLTAFILDKARLFNPYLMLEVLETLSLVLRERPKCDEELEYFDNGSDFSSRLIELLFQAKSLPAGSVLVQPQTPLRSGLAAAAYRTLISAYEVSDGVWTAFTTDATVVTLHAQLLLDKDIDFSARVSHPIANLFDGQTSSRELQDFYWRVLYPCIPQAMSAAYMSESYFAIANKVLDSFDPTQREESWARELVEGLNSQLWSYQHSECPPLFTSDRAMTGLLRLFSKAVGILKKKNKGLRPLDGLPLQLFRHLLFPPPTDTQHHPLVQEEIRGTVYDLIRSSFALETDYNELVNLALEAAQGSVRDSGAGFPGMSEWIRPPCNASGLTNLGMTCYMNSLLQQLFANLQFRKFILDQQVVDFNKQDILFRVQQLFANMQDSIKPYADTGDLAAALNVQVGIQEDVHTFYTTLLSRLEDAMPDKESRRALTSFFTGKSVTQIKGDCGHVSSREEPFTELSITVKNKASLHDSLNEFVQGEPLEGSNKYMCMSCESENDGRLVNALRRTCLDEVPNSLTVCLKRFAFENILDGENKVNDRFEFPAEIDMSLYNRSHLENPDADREPDVFELVGVIVHQGSLSYGHYWSYVRVPGPPHLYRCPWIYLEDGRSFQCGGGIQEVQEQCFGGLRWSDGTERPDSAYVLFYQRKSYVSEADGLNAVARHLQIDQQILPTVPVQTLVEEGVEKDNTWRVRIALLFSNQFSEFLKWLLEQYPLKLKSRRDAIESLKGSDETRADHDIANDELDGRIGELIVTYVLRIFLPDPKSERKLPDLMTSLNIVADSNPAIAAHIVRHFAHDEFGCDTLSRHRSSKVRSNLFGFIETCLASVRHVSTEYYDGLASVVIKAHSYLLHNAVGIVNGSTLDTFPYCWPEYLAFAANFAKIGSKETSLVLEQGYLGWIYEMILFPWDPKTKKRHMALTNNLKSGTVDRSPLYDFLHDLFDGHVDLSDYSARYLVPGNRELTSRGYRLREEEIDPLLMQNPKLDRFSTSLLFDTGVHQCSIKGIRWRDYAPGKLVGLLVGDCDNEVLSERIWEYMKIQYDREEKELDPLLHMTLHICLRLQNVPGGTQRCKDLLEQLSRNLLLWESRERKSLWFFREAYLLAPEAVVQSFPIWAPKFLTVENVQSRQATSDCLKDIIFGPAPMQNDLLEATRIRSTRRFVSKCQQDLDIARQHNERRGRHECMITAMKHASDYLIALQEEIQHQQEHDISISNRVMVEYDELKPYVALLVDYLEGLGDWEPETILPTRTLGIRRSVEVDDSDELDESDADVEDVMSEVSGY